LYSNVKLFVYYANITIQNFYQEEILTGKARNENLFHNIKFLNFSFFLLPEMLFEARRRNIAIKATKKSFRLILRFRRLISWNLFLHCIALPWVVHSPCKSRPIWSIKQHMYKNKTVETQVLHSRMDHLHRGSFLSYTIYKDFFVPLQSSSSSFQTRKYRAKEVYTAC
jgi:hypothetical protein